MTLSGMTYRCSAGESFDLLALALYGDEKYAADMIGANPQYSDRLVFVGGEVLQLPVVDLPEDDEDEKPYQSAKAPWKE